MRRVLVDRDLVMEAADGVRLLATRYRPIGVERGPVVLIRTPYGRKPGLASRFLEVPIARAGYQVVVQSVRGTFGSGGVFHPGIDERGDGVAAVDWLRGSAFCDGRVAMVGGSYLASTQWAIGPVVEPPLDGMAVSIGSSSMLPGWYPQGAFGAGQSLRWVALLDDQARARSVLRSLTAGRRVRRALRGPGFVTADEQVLGRESPFYREQFAHVDDPAHWDGVIDFGGDRERLSSPVSVVTGWHDLFLRQSLDDVRALQAAGRAPRLTIGPWWHGDLRLLPTAAREAVALLDRVWRNRSDGRASVRVRLQGARRWRDLSAWPPPTSPRTVVFAPRVAGGRSRSRTIVFDPADPTPGRGGPGLLPPAGRRRQRRVESRRDVVVLTAPPFQDALTVIGSVRVVATVSTAAQQAMIVARLCDVDRFGVSRNLTEGLLLLKGPMERRAMTIELDSTAFRLRPGRRLRLQLAPGAHPRVVLPDPGGRSSRYAVTVHAGPQHELQVELPLHANA